MERKKLVYGNLIQERSMQKREKLHGVNGVRAPKDSIRPSIAET